MQTGIIAIIPVLPPAGIARGIAWYKAKPGFDARYAVLYRDNSCIHLQWHADTASDPLGGGSVIRMNAKNR
jgi:hypothetical protein